MSEVIDEVQEDVAKEEMAQEEVQEDMAKSELWVPRPRMIGPSESKTLTMEISEERYHALTDERTDAILEKVDVETEKKSAMKAFNEQIETLENRIVKIARALKSHKEETTVRCTWFYDYTNNIAELVRGDTHETIERRPLTSAEKQQKLALDEDRHPDDREELGLFDDPAGELGDEQTLVDSLIREVRAELRENGLAIRTISLSTGFAETFARVLSDTENRPNYWPAQFRPDALFRVPLVEMEDQEEPWVLVMLDAAAETGEPGTDEEVDPDGLDLTPIDEEAKFDTLESARNGTWAEGDTE